MSDRLGYRMLPGSSEAEQALLCSILIDPEVVLGLCVELGVNSEWFVSPAHVIVFTNLRRMEEERSAIDVLYLTQWLADRQLLEQVGGAFFLSTLSTYLPTALNAISYITILKEKFALRKLIHLGNTYVQRAYEEQSEVWDIIDEFEAAALKVRPTKTLQQIEGPRTAVIQAIEQIQSLHDKRGSITGIATGFRDLDQMTDGFHPGEMIVIGARPSHGKTAIAMNIAEELVMNQRRPVGVFSLEMTKVQLIQRLLCSMSRVNLSRVRDGLTTDKDWSGITSAATKAASSPLYIDDTAGLSIQELRSRARRMKSQFGIEALVVDYLQLLKGGARRYEMRSQEVSEVSNGLKECARELDLPLIVLAQLGRAFEQRGPSARPRLSDLRESGSIEQDADVILFLSRPELMVETPQEKAEVYGMAELMVAKQRNGPTGDVALTFLKEYTRFTTRATAEELQEQVNQQPQLL